MTPLAAPAEALARFGFDAFRPGQEQVVDALLAGRSALAVFPTGGGKSLCYQLPALLLEGLTLVVSPLIALMKDQVDALQARGIAAARLDSTLSHDEASAIYAQLEAGQLSLLYVAPERLANEGFLRRLRRLPVALLAIDEAHCISEWGHNFRPDYLKLARFAEEQGVGRVLALTATATPAVSADVRRAFGIDERDHVQTGFHRPNLELRVSPTPAGERPARLLARLQERPDEPAIVYVTLQHTAETVAAGLQRGGVDARAYHAGLDDDERTAIQDAFMSGACRVVVATIAFGMGIDKADIRAVYHYNLPKTLENYVQEIGRAGRDGEPAWCETLACADDTVVLGNFSYGDTPEPVALQALLEDLFGRGPEFSVSRWSLSQTHDIRPLVVATVLTYLELRDLLRATGPFYSGYKFQLPRGEEEVCGRFDAGRAEFLRAVFGAAKKGRSWYSLDPHTVALELHEPRERIVDALTYLEGQGELILRPSGLRHGYRRGEAPFEIESLFAEMLRSFEERETRDAERLAGVLAFCEHPGCSTRELLGYFGEGLEEDCGHCGRCAGEAASPLPRSQPMILGDPERAVVEELRSEGRAALSTPRQLTRFLCGLSSPASGRAHLRRHERFGWFSPLPFPEVLEFVRDVVRANPQPEVREPAPAKRARPKRKLPGGRRLRSRRR